MARKLCSRKISSNALFDWKKARSVFRVAFNTLVIYSMRLCPSNTIKNFAYSLIGIKIGKNSCVGMSVIFDVFEPELIEIGSGCGIGFDSLILAHEFWRQEYRTGKTTIGNNVMIGARAIILAGVNIGDNSSISSGTLVNSDVPPNSFAYGNPMKIEKKH